jgi:L-fucose isomerase-like protein
VGVPMMTRMCACARRATMRSIQANSKRPSSGYRDSIDGVIVTLPNFGDERAIANTLRWAGLDVPVLIQATPDTPAR